MRPLHRMPVILEPTAYELWLDPAVQEPDTLHALLRPYPPEATLAYPASPRVDNPLDDTPECVEPLKQDK